MQSSLCSIIRWLSGRRRSLSRKLIDYFIRGHLFYYSRLLRLESNKEIFQKAWVAIDGNRFINALVAHCQHPFQLSNREYNLLVLMKRMHKAGIFYIPELLFPEDERIKALIESEASFLVASAHNGFAFTSRVISEAGRKVVTIAANPEQVRRTTLKRSGVTAEIRMIERNMYCMARLQQAVKESMVVCCDIDFQTGTVATHQYVSPVLFKFAKNSQLRIIFAKYEITDAGMVQVLFHEPDNDQAPDEMADQFIKYINSSRTRKRMLAVEKFNLAA